MKLVLSVLLIASFISPILAAEKGSTKKAATKKEAPAESKVPAAAQKAADSLSDAQTTKLLEIINKGDDKELATLPGIGETRAAAVKKARPVKAVTDLLAIDGIGEGTYAEIVAHAKAGFPGTEAKATTEKKADSGAAKGKKKKATTKSKGTKKE